MFGEDEEFVFFLNNNDLDLHFFIDQRLTDDREGVAEKIETCDAGLASISCERAFELQY